MESEDRENSSASENKMETQQIFSSIGQGCVQESESLLLYPSNMVTPSPDKNEPLYMANKIEQV